MSGDPAVGRTQRSGTLSIARALRSAAEGQIALVEHHADSRDARQPTNEPAAERSGGYVRALQQFHRERRELTLRA